MYVRQRVGIENFQPNSVVYLDGTKWRKWDVNGSRWNDRYC